MKFKYLGEESSKTVYLERGTDYYGMNSNEDLNSKYGLFFVRAGGRNSASELELIKSQENSGFNLYGFKSIYKLLPNAKIYNAHSCEEAILKNNLWGYKSDILYEVTNHKFKTLYDAIKYLYKVNNYILDDEDFYNGKALRVLDGDTVYFYLQDVLAEFLRSKGYDGVYYDRDIEPYMYLIWNLSVVIPLKIDHNKFVPITWNDKKLRLAITHSFYGPISVEVEDEIINALNLKESEYEDLSQSQLDSYMRVYIKDLFDKDLLKNISADRVDDAKSRFIPDIDQYDNSITWGNSNDTKKINNYISNKLYLCKNQLNLMQDSVDDMIDILQLSVNSNFKTKTNSRLLNDLYIIRKSVSLLLDKILDYK